MTRKQVASIAVLMVALAQVTTGIAQGGFISNGNFSSIASGPTSGQLAYSGYTGGTTLSNWTSTGYNFLYNSGQADTTGATGESGNVKLWGPGGGTGAANYANNGLPASSPVGGNFIAADGAYETGAIQQTMTGLTVGFYYQVSFWWAGAQQSGFSGATTEQWQVGFGNSTQLTAVASDVNHGFTGWIKETFTFKADAANDVLSFLSIGTPSGEPPFALLAGVSVTVPEPSSILMLGLGLGGLIAFGRRRKLKAIVA